MRRVLALVMMVALGACTLDKQEAPALAGPSGLGLSLAVTATPDILPQDGSSEAVIQVVAMDASNQPITGLAVKTEVILGGAVIAATTVTTGSDGKASAVFTSPGFLGVETTAIVRATAIGSDFAGSQSRTALIRLSVF